VFWIATAIFVLAAGFLVRRRRRHPADTESWRASLPPDEPLDVEGIRRAEAEWEAEEEGWVDSDDDSDETWR
jgi:hypothetical protein